MSGRLVGRTALITGGGRGIGEAIGLAFAGEGAELMLVSRTEKELNAVADRCRAMGRRCFIGVGDVSVRADVARLVAAALRDLGHVDVLVNAAGVYGPIGPVTDVDLAEWARALSVNLLGVLYTCHDVIPSMQRRRSGSIINFSGGGATSPLPRFSAYGVSKAAVVRLSETLAEEVAGDNIRVNAIAPGAIDTKLQNDVLEAGARAGALYQRISALRESGDGGTPVSVPAELAVFLGSDASAGLTGRLISAPHDPWRDWDPAKIAALASTPWYTLRRLDPFTIKPLRDGVP
jgi:NAD(P)-dependent dehydrogenase (short-subunit alcohol dehydrogenase family)